MRIGEAIEVNEYQGNELTSVRKATLFRDGTIEYWPEPVYEEEEDECNTY